MTSWATSTPLTIRTLALSCLITLVACEKKAPPDPHLQQGFALLGTNPELALKEFEQAREAKSAKVSLGRGLALEGLHRYVEAEQALEQAHAQTDNAAVLLPLVRVELMLGKNESARRYAARVLELAPSELSALLLQTCLTGDDAQAQLVLGDLDGWAKLREKDQGAKGNSPIPAEYHLARASLLGQLRRGRDKHAATVAAEQSPLLGVADALALATLAMRAGRSDFAGLLLERVRPEARSWTQRRQMAELSHVLGQHEVTARVLSTLLGSEDADLLRLRARHEFATRAPGAIDSLRRALQVTEDVNTRLEFRLALAETYLRRSEPAEARKIVDKLLAEHPSASGAQLLLARVDLVSGDAEAAVARLQPALSGKGEVPAGAREIAVLALMQAGRPQAALPLLTALLKENPHHHMAARTYVAIELEAGRGREALVLLSDLVRQAPRDLELRLLWIGLMRKVEPAAKVQQALRESVNELPSETRLWFELARQHHQQKQPQLAILVLEEAYQKNEQDLLIVAALAADLTKYGQKNKAAPLYELILRHAADDVVALNNLAMFHVDELGDVQRGVELAERALTLAPMQPAVADTLGWALFRRGSPEDLKRAEQLLASVRDQLGSPTSKFHLGAVLLTLGKSEEGKALITQALALTPEFPEAEQARKMLGRGS